MVAMTLADRVAQRSVAVHDLDHAFREDAQPLEVWLLSIAITGNDIATYATQQALARIE